MHTMQHDVENSGWSSALGVFLLGAVAGSTIALLTAPSSGKEMREFLRGAAEDLGETMERISGTVQRVGSKMMKSGQEVYDEARREIGGSRGSRSANRMTRELDGK